MYSDPHIFARYAAAVKMHVMAAKPQPMEDSLGETVLLGLGLGLVCRP